MKYLLIDNLELVPIEVLKFQIYYKKEEEKSYLRIELRDGIAYEYEVKNRELKEEEKEELYRILVRTLNSRYNPVSTGLILERFRAFFLNDSAKPSKGRGRRKRK